MIKRYKIEMLKQKTESLSEKDSKRYIDSCFSSIYETCNRYLIHKIRLMITDIIGNYGKNLEKYGQETAQMYASFGNRIKNHFYNFAKGLSTKEHIIRDMQENFPDFHGILPKFEKIFREIEETNVQKERLIDLTIKETEKIIESKKSFFKLVKLGTAIRFLFEHPHKWKKRQLYSGYYNYEELNTPIEVVEELERLLKEGKTIDEIWNESFEKQFTN